MNKHTTPLSEHLNSPALATVLQDPRGALTLLAQTQLPHQLINDLLALDTSSKDTLPVMKIIHLLQEVLFAM